MADQFRFSVKIMPPARDAPANLAVSPQKPLAQFMIGSNPRETFEDVWQKIQTSFEKSYNNKITSQGWFHKLQTADGFDIVVSKEKVGDLGFGPHTPADQLKLVMLLNPIDREGSLMYTTALRPTGYKRPRMSAEAEQRSKRQRQEEQRYGARVEDIDCDFPVISRESVSHDAEQWPKDVDGFTIPRRRQSPLPSPEQVSPLVPSARATPRQRSPSIIRSDAPVEAESLRDPETTLLVTPNGCTHDASASEQVAISDTSSEHSISPPIPVKETRAQHRAVLEPHPVPATNTRGPPTPVSAEEAQRAPTSAQRPILSPPIPAASYTHGGDVLYHFSIAKSTQSRDHPSDVGQSASKLRSRSSKPKPTQWSAEEDNLLVNSFNAGLNSTQIVKALFDQLGSSRSTGSIRYKKKELIGRGRLAADLPRSSQNLPSSSAAQDDSVFDSSPLLPRGNGKALPTGQRTPWSLKARPSKSASSSSSRPIQTKLPFTSQREDSASTTDVAQASSKLDKGKGRADGRPRSGFTAINRPALGPVTADQSAFVEMLQSDDILSVEQNHNLPRPPPIQDSSQLLSTSAVSAKNVDSDEGDEAVQSTFGSSVFNQRITHDEAATVLASLGHVKPSSHAESSPLSNSVPGSAPSSMENRQEPESQPRVPPAFFPTEILMGEYPYNIILGEQPEHDEHRKQSDEVGEQDKMEDELSEADLDLAQNARNKKLFEFASKTKGQTNINASLDDHRNDSSTHDDTDIPALRSSTATQSGSTNRWKDIYRNWSRECRNKVAPKHAIANDEENSDDNDDNNQQESDDEDQGEERARSNQASPDSQEALDSEDHELQSYKMLEIRDAVNRPLSKPEAFVTDDEDIEDSADESKDLFKPKDDGVGSESDQDEAAVESEEEDEDSSESDNDKQEHEAEPPLSSHAADEQDKRETSNAHSAAPGGLWHLLKKAWLPPRVKAQELKGPPGISKLRKAAMNAHIPPAPVVKTVSDLKSQSVVSISSDESSESDER